MKKSTLFFVFLIINSLVYSQSESSILKYKADGIYIVLQNNKGEQLTRIPFGKDVEIEYDTFFKTFDITYVDREGSIDGMELLFLSDREYDGVKYHQMKDEHGNIYNVFGNVDKTGKLLLILDKKDEDGNLILLVIEQAKKQ